MTARRPCLRAKNKPHEQQFFCLTRHPPVRNAHQKNARIYYGSVTKILMTLGSTGATTLCVQTASPAWLKIKNFSEHAHKPNALNYKNTYKT